MCAVALTGHALRFESLLAQPTGEARRERCNDVSKYRAPAVKAPKNSSCTDLNLTKTCMARMSNFDWMHASSIKYLSDPGTIAIENNQHQRLNAVI